MYLESEWRGQGRPVEEAAAVVQSRLCCGMRRSLLGQLEELRARIQLASPVHEIQKFKPRTVEASPQDATGPHSGLVRARAAAGNGT